MKKGILLVLFSGVLGIEVMAQSLVRLDSVWMGTDPVPFESLQSDPFYGKRIIGDWFNFMEASDANAGGAISYIVYTNNTLFPDSLVLQRYGDSILGYRLGPVNLHHIGQVFDPKSFYYSDLLSSYNSYTIDSISLAYRYSHQIPGTVDTLEFQIYHDTAVKSGNLMGPDISEPSAWLKYNRHTDKGLGSSQTWRTLLDADDTSWAGYKVVHLKLPDPVYVKPNGLFAATYRYIPGYSYSPGDTIDHTWNDPVPNKKLNHFQPLIGTDTVKTEEDSYNHGLSIRTFNKYAANDHDYWAEEFIPGDAWNKYIEYVYMGFKVFSYVGLIPIAENSVKVYPNPAIDVENVTIAFTTTVSTDITIELYDLLGNKVQSLMEGKAEAGEQRIVVNTASLASGMYVYRIKAGEQTLSGKVGIVY